MRNIWPLAACGVICIVLLMFRISNSDMRSDTPLKVTVWDAFGYYVYLPSTIIYKDCTQLKWLPAIDSKYGVTGGNGWQAEKAGNGNYVFKYLGGVAIMELPLFFIGHYIAGATNYPQDGFSPPYQYALGFGVIGYCLLSLFLLRKVLLAYFSDFTVTITLLAICLATNFIQYAAVDNGQSHAYIFSLYVLVLYTTMQWHRQPAVKWAAATGFIIGLATISRPTEAIMLFIPLMWNMHTKAASKQKWDMLRNHKAHGLAIGIFGLVGILPQLIYWKSTAGSFIYDVGSKWEFFAPHFRVLLGWEKGWLIYTPITVFFLAGMFFIKKYPFRKSVLWFCLLNIYIIIAWHDWRYGGSYSTRALVQSYPVFALPFAAFTERMKTTKWFIPFLALCVYLLMVNLFQTDQYCKTILHYNDMNRRYYGRIYLNPDPTPADMSLLDNSDFISNETTYRQRIAYKADSMFPLTFNGNDIGKIAELHIVPASTKERWLKIQCLVKAPDCLWQTYLNGELKDHDSTKAVKVRLFSPISKNDIANSYLFYLLVPERFKDGQFRLFLTSPFNFKGVISKVEISELDK